jgi:uncharacterized protein YoxC
MTLKELHRLLDEKLSRIEATQVEMKVTLAEQAKDIAYHIKRTNLLEERVNQVAAELKPVTDHVTVLRGMIKALSIVGLLLGIVFTWLRIRG